MTVCVVRYVEVARNYAVTLSIWVAEVAGYLCILLGAINYHLTGVSASFKVSRPAYNRSSSLKSGCNIIIMYIADNTVVIMLHYLI